LSGWLAGSAVKNCQRLAARESGRLVQMSTHKFEKGQFFSIEKYFYCFLFSTALFITLIAKKVIALIPRVHKRYPKTFE
jgi:hypothetical protein